MWARELKDWKSKKETIIDESQVRNNKNWLQLKKSIKGYGCSLTEFTWNKVEKCNHMDMTVEKIINTIITKDI